jgi:nucleoside-diphosphate-sugar epimerase
MLIVITGGTGFLGQQLARRLLARGELTGGSGRPESIERLVLLDAAPAPMQPLWADARVATIVGDITDRELLSNVVDRDDVSVFHLASMVSAGAEADFDGALRVNLDGGRAILEACRARGGVPRLVFTSSIAAFGGEPIAESVSDSSKLTPETTYGTTKAICELLVNDYSRKGFLDGRSARLPTVVIRPGRPNAAASSWVSGILREPLNGEETTLPVEPDTGVPISGYRTIVENLIALHELPGSALGVDRAVSLPALNVTAGEMLEALQRASDRPLGTVHVEPDPTVTDFFCRWAQHSSFERATRLGLSRDESLEGVIGEYIEDFLPPPPAT